VFGRGRDEVFPPDIRTIVVWLMQIDGKLDRILEIVGEEDDGEEEDAD
jgi:hypothetical protein